jgi:hypothetical protein
VSTAGRIGWLFAVGLCLVAEIRADEFNPYQVPKEQFRSRVHTIALLPLRMPSDTMNAADVRERFESLIAESLRQKGYTVVPSSQFERVWRQMSERLNGTFDPLTGDAIKDRYVTALQYTGRELARTDQVDALLASTISIGDVGFDCRFTCSTWNEPLLWHGKTFGDPPQKVWGAFLNVVISDLEQVELYGIRSGIEWTAVFIARGRFDKPREHLFLDLHRDAQAVVDDLEPLVAASGKE